jgi:hypothetical protein
VGGTGSSAGINMTIADGFAANNGQDGILAVTAVAGSLDFSQVSTG